VLVFYNIAVTANANETEKDKCMKVGMAEFIPKPFRIGDFVRLISIT
jgi:CheY-like chemotaxis protein